MCDTYTEIGASFCAAGVTCVLSLDQAFKPDLAEITGLAEPDPVSWGLQPCQ
jgi:hypothetical protein